MILSFTADRVATYRDDFGGGFGLVSIALESDQTDDDDNANSWNFQRSVGDDEDDGVCTVREPQLGVHYEGITAFTLRRGALVCSFNSDATRELGCAELHVTFDLADDAWQELAAAAQSIFKDRDYFKLFI